MARNDRWTPAVTRRASVRCRPGDVVWGRETWRECNGVVVYRADGGEG